MLDSRLQKIIAQKLLSFPSSSLNEWSFKDTPSDRLLKNIPNAFLFAVIMDYGIKAERAWAAPYELKQRLGHLNINKIAEMSETNLSRMLRRTPALHRFCNNLARYLISASKKLRDEYSGNAANIWENTHNSAEVLVRLLDFDGMGSKKSHMMAKILVDEFGIKMDTQYIDVQYDTHIKRVFKRAGLSLSDSFESIILAGRILNPKYPGALDTPAWIIGRKWCHPRKPDCKNCYISNLCPKIGLLK